jgi:hypothetical protein
LATAGGGGSDAVQLGGVLLVSVDVTAEGAVDELEGKLVRGRFVQPDDEGGGEETAQPDRVLLLAGEDLVLLVELLALQLHPLFVAAEDILELLQRTQPELALAVELGAVADAVGDFDETERVAVVARLLVAVAVGRLLLVGVEGEGALDAVADPAAEGAVGVAVVTLLQQGRRRRQRPFAAERQPALLGVGLEEGVGGLRVGDREDDQQTDEDDGDQGGSPDRRSDNGRADPRPDQCEDPDQDPGQRLAQQPLEVEAAQVVGVVGDACRRRVCVCARSHGPQPTAPARMQTGLQRGVVLQSGGEWVIVAIELKPRTGVVRFLPPHHSGPILFRLSPPVSERTRRGGLPRSLRAQPRFQGPAHGSFSLPGFPC